MDYQEIINTVHTLRLYQISHVSRALRDYIEEDKPISIYFSGNSQKILEAATNLDDTQLRQLVDEIDLLYDVRMAVTRSQCAYISYSKKVVPNPENEQGFEITNYGSEEKPSLKLLCFPDNQEYVFVLYHQGKQIARHRQHYKLEEDEWLDKFTPIIQALFRNDWAE